MRRAFNVRRCCMKTLRGLGRVASARCPVAPRPAGGSGRSPSGPAPTPGGHRGGSYAPTPWPPRPRRPRRSQRPPIPRPPTAGACAHSAGAPSPHTWRRAWLRGPCRAALYIGVRSRHPITWQANSRRRPKRAVSGRLAPAYWRCCMIPRAPAPAVAGGSSARWRDARCGRRPRRRPWHRGTPRPSARRPTARDPAPPRPHTRHAAAQSRPHRHGGHRTGIGVDEDHA